jgi:hypothetical protein
MKASMLSRISTLALKAQQIALTSQSNAASGQKTTMVVFIAPPSRLYTKRLAVT